MNRHVFVFEGQQIKSQQFVNTNIPVIPTHILLYLESNIWMCSGYNFYSSVNNAYYSSQMLDLQFAFAIFVHCGIPTFNLSLSNIILVNSVPYKGA